MDGNIINQINSPLKEIISTLRKPIKLMNDAKNNIKIILENESGNNILEYSKYINDIIKKESIIDLINLFDLNERLIFNKIM